MNSFERKQAERQMARVLEIEPRHVCIVGSTLICGKGTDVDYLCLVESEDVVTQKGFDPDTDLQYESDLRSFRRADENVIATTNPSFFFAEVAIAHAARVAGAEKFDMANRDHRVDFHSQVRAQVTTRLHEDLST